MLCLPRPDPGDPDLRGPVRFLFWQARRQRRLLFGSTILGILWMGSQAFVPAVVGKALDAGVGGRNLSALLLWTGVLGALSVVQALTHVARHRLSVLSWSSAAYSVVQLVARQTAALGARLPRRVGTGEVVSVGTTDMNQIGGALDICGRAAGAVGSMVIVAVILLTTSVPLGLLVLIGVPVVVLSISPMLRPLQYRQGVQRERIGALSTLGADIVSGLRVLRGVGGEQTYLDRYWAESRRVRAAGFRVARLEALLDGAQVLLPGLFVVMLVWAGARLALAGRISVGELVACYGYAAFLVEPLRNATEVVRRLTRGLVSARRVIRILGLPTEPADAPAPTTPQPLASPPRDPTPQPPDAEPGPHTPTPEPPAPEPRTAPTPEPRAPKPPTAPTSELHAPVPGVPGFSAGLCDPGSGLVVAAGRLTAVACAQVEEASALADRLGRYTDSEVTLDGRPLTAIPLAEVRRRILVVDTQTTLFSGPLRAELDPDRRLTDGVLLTAVEAASALEVVQALPDGLDTEIQERGRSFSGGQRQRLVLARALLADPEVLILVEPTPSVDAPTEARIADRLRVARAGRTTVVFSASPLVLDRAELVAWLEAGRVVATGTHQQLLRTCPGYRDLVLRGMDRGPGRPRTEAS